MLKCKLWLACFVLGTLNAVFAKKSQNMDFIDMTEWKLPADDKYLTFHKLTAGDFHHRVMHSRDAWIIVIYKEKIRKQWRRQAESLKAALWFGSLDYDQEDHFVQALIPDVDQYDVYEGIALVFPFGGKKAAFSKKWPKVVTSPEEAEKVLRPTFPSNLMKSTFEDKEMLHFQNWIVLNYYKSKPPKFPVLCIIDEKEPPLFLLAISSYFSNFFGLSVVQKNDVPKLMTLLKRVPVPPVYPYYYLLLGKEPSSEDMKNGKFGITFDILPFNPRKYGEPHKFLAVTKFLFTANEDYRENLLGRHTDEEADLSDMVPIRDALNSRLKDIAGFDHRVKTEL